MAQPPSSSFVGSWGYHVFLSFRGEDTRYSFTDHLHSALCGAGIKTFMDYQLQRGEEISTALLKAIEESKISIVVFSENYASSRWCLEELVKILECRQSKKQLVRPIFYKVDPSHVRKQEESFGNAFATLECKHKDNMDKWRAALTEAANLSGWTSRGHESEFAFIQKIVGEISEQLGHYAHLDVAEYPVGMESRVQHVNALLDLEEDNIVRTVGIWGTGGIGKTTIAKAVYNSIANKFEGCCFLANVRESSESHEGLVKLQKTLLSEILSGPKLKVANLYQGVTLIKEFLRNRKVLLVLDDVNHVKQLDNLAGGSDWFGAGSRIIMTTRDKKVLMAHDVNSIYNVMGLDHHEALKLFSRNAFRGNAPSADYEKLVGYGISRAGGLPLVLILLGRHLRGESVDIWKSTLDGLMRGQELQDTFIISYNQLDKSVKQVFLDIACFFKGQDINYVTEILEACEPNAKYGVKVLIEKALISIEGTEICLHDSLEEMGKQIVIDESPAPGERSRLWFHEDVRHVLEENTGTNKVKGIMVDKEICLNMDSFVGMKNLRIFINYYSCISGDVGYLPNGLRVLHWYRCNLQSFPTNFRPTELFALYLPRNLIKQPAESFKGHFIKLAYLDLSYSEYLTQIPDLSGLRNLKELCAHGCGNLVKIDPSVGHLAKLEILYFSSCINLTHIPDLSGFCNLKKLIASHCENLVEVDPSVGHLAKLEILDFAYCINLTHIPDLSGSYNLKKLVAFDCENLVEVDPSVGNLAKLEDLNFSGCTNLRKFPKELRLKSLKHFCLRGCSRLENFPEIMDIVESLSYLVFEGTSIQKLPSSIEKLIGLKELLLSESAIQELPSSIGQLIGLKKLTLSITAIKELPSSIEQLTGLKELYLNNTAIKKLPSSIGQLTGLSRLYLNNTAIKKLPSSIGQLTGLQGLHLGCTAIEKLPSSIGQLTRLKMLSLDNTPIKVLPSSIGNLLCLRELLLNKCPELVTLPSIGNLPNLMSIEFEECNASNMDSPAVFGCSSQLQWVNLSRNKFVRLPLCISKFVSLKSLKLLGCTRLREISEPLPPNIEEINVGECISLERFSTLSKMLEDGDMRMIMRMNLSNCQLLCDTVGMDVSKMARILLNNQPMKNNLGIQVVLPGTEVPEWFSCCKNVHDDHLMVRSDEDHDREVVFEIPWGLKWEKTMSLVLCIVLTITDPHSTSLCNYEDVCVWSYITIDGVRIANGDFSIVDDLTEIAPSSLVLMKRLNIALPLDMKTNAEVDDAHSSNQLMPYKSLVFHYYCQRGHILKSCGFHLQPQAPKQWFSLSPSQLSLTLPAGCSEEAVECTEDVCMPDLNMPNADKNDTNNDFKFSTGTIKTQKRESCGVHLQPQAPKERFNLSPSELNLNLTLPTGCSSEVVEWVENVCMPDLNMQNADKNDNDFKFSTVPIKKRKRESSGGFK